MEEKIKMVGLEGWLLYVNGTKTIKMVNIETNQWKEVKTEYAFITFIAVVGDYVYTTSDLYSPLIRWELKNDELICVEKIEIDDDVNCMINFDGCLFLGCLNGIIKVSHGDKTIVEDFSSIRTLACDLLVWKNHLLAATYDGVCVINANGEHRLFTDTPATKVMIINGFPYYDRDGKVFQLNGKEFATNVTGAFTYNDHTYVIRKNQICRINCKYQRVIGHQFKRNVKSVVVKDGYAYVAIGQNVISKMRLTFEYRDYHRMSNDMKKIVFMADCCFRVKGLPRDIRKLLLEKFA